MYAGKNRSGGLSKTMSKRACDDTECKTRFTEIFPHCRFARQCFSFRDKIKGENMKRIGVVGIVLKGDKALAVEMQKVLSEFADIIIGRMGVPREKANAIALIVEGSQERISALTGKLGRLPKLNVKSAITAFETEE